MKVSLRWLSEFIDLPTTDIEELRYVFTMLGHEVEGVATLEADWSDVYVGEVTEISEHPDADRIRVCQVDIGDGREQIICGAWNFGVGARVAVATPGAVLPGDFEIGRREIRGIVSNGMICSEAELGLGEDSAGIIVLGKGPPPGAPFAELVELPDTVFDLDITPNRPDAMSMLGIARDLAARFDIGFRLPERELQTVEGNTPVSVEVEDTHGCRRFTAREIVGVEVGPSPFWLRHRLAKLGVRAISNVVDVTNYVMFEVGHPLHAFDADRIVGDHLVVKRATQGEVLRTLDDVERELSSDDLIIYDDVGPTSMSGTMGGDRSEVSSETSRVLMEAASWDPPTIMYMSRRQGLRSEASTRFERGVDPNLADIANRRACALVMSLTGGEVLEGAVDIIARPTEPEIVHITSTEVERHLGPGFDSSHITGLLERLGMSVDGHTSLSVTIPTFRPDITRPADLIEEIARIHGYDRFEATIPTGPWGGLTREQRRGRLVNEVLVGLGLDQAINLPFVNPDDLRKLGDDSTGSGLLSVKNPLREEESKLRPSIIPGLLNSIRYNLSHGSGSVALFEVGKVFSSAADPRDPRLPVQYDRLGWAIVGDVGMHTLDRDGLSADGTVSLGIWHRLSHSLGMGNAELEPAVVTGFHPGRSARVKLDGKTIGHVGELSPRSARAFEIPGRVAVAEIDLDPLLEPVPPHQSGSPSPFPHVDFDLSFVVPQDVTAADLVDATTTAGAGLVERARVFDEFRGEGLDGGVRALAIRYRLRSSDHTLTGEEVGPIRETMIAAATELGAALRGAS